MQCLIYIYVCIHVIFVYESYIYLLLCMHIIAVAGKLCNFGRHAWWTWAVRGLDVDQFRMFHLLLPQADGISTQYKSTQVRYISRII